MVERKALLSVEKDGETYFFDVGDKTVKDMLAVVENDNAVLSAYSALGRQIDIYEFTLIQQSDAFTQSVEAVLDGYEKKVEIYTVNNGKGGVAEADRTDLNSNIVTYTYDAEIKGLIWKDNGEGNINAEYYGEHVCSVDHATNEYTIGNKGGKVIDTYDPDDPYADHKQETREYVKTLPLYKDLKEEKAGKLFADIGHQLSKSEIDSAIRFDNSIAYTLANVKYPDKDLSHNSKEETIMDEQSINKEILEELKALREQVTKLEQRAEASEQKLDAISAFIAASNEAQTFEKTMHIAEKVTEQITGCEKAEFYALDADKRFFTTDGADREYQSTDSKTNALLRAIESKNVSIEDVRVALIPVVSKDDKAIGVIVAEKSDGFDGVDFTQFGKDRAIMSQIDLAVKKELTHQENITDKVTGLKNAQGLAEYVDANADKTVTVMLVTADLPKEDPESALKDIAKAIDNKGRSNINDNVYALDGGKFVSVMSCDEKKAKSIADMLSMSVKNISVEVKTMTAAQMIGADAGREEKSKQPTYHNKEAYSQIVNKFHISGCSTKTASSISGMAEKEGVVHSVKYDGDRSVVTLDGDRKDFCYKALGYAKKHDTEHSVEHKAEKMSRWGDKAKTLAEHQKEQQTEKHDPQR